MDKPIAEHIVGEDSEEIIINSLEMNCIAADTMISQARRKLTMFTRDLDPRVFDREPIYQAVKDLATYSRFSEVRVLLVDPDRVIKEGHRLITLARRLSSYIQIRKVGSDYQYICSSFIVVDDKAYIYRSLATQYDAVVNFNEPNRARELLRQFTDVWEYSAPDPNLRVLHI